MWTSLTLRSEVKYRRVAASTRNNELSVAFLCVQARRENAAHIVTEPISMAPHQNVSYRARAWNDDNLDGLIAQKTAARHAPGDRAAFSREAHRSDPPRPAALGGNVG